jgi:selT/selW/selH-like putative selenoprotein
MPKASRLEEELKANFNNISVELIRGSGGVFEVKVDGEMIFSKNSGPNATYRFPDDGEVTGLIRQ